MRLDKLGVIGSLFGATAAAPACCLPLLASVAATLGLNALPIDHVWRLRLLEGFLLLTVASALMGWRIHRRWGPLLLALGATAAVIYVYDVAPSQPVALIGLTGLVGAAVWNTWEARRRGHCGTPSLQLRSTLTCPHCGRVSVEQMPVDACLFFHDCAGCGQTLKPKAGDCCVFCSYGSVPCPPQQGGNCCSGEHRA